MHEERRRLSPGELAEIEQRARGVGGSVIHVPTVLALAQRDVPALLAEVRRLRSAGEAAAGTPQDPHPPGKESV